MTAHCSHRGGARLWAWACGFRGRDGLTSHRGPPTTQLPENRKSGGLPPAYWSLATSRSQYSYLPPGSVTPRTAEDSSTKARSVTWSKGEVMYLHTTHSVRWPDVLSPFRNIEGTGIPITIAPRAGASMFLPFLKVNS